MKLFRVLDAADHESSFTLAVPENIPFTVSDVKRSLQDMDRINDSIEMGRDGTVAVDAACITPGEVPVNDGLFTNTR